MMIQQSNRQFYFMLQKNLKQLFLRNSWNSGEIQTKIRINFNSITLNQRSFSVKYLNIIIFLNFQHKGRMRNIIIAFLFLFILNVGNFQLVCQGDLLQNPQNQSQCICPKGSKQNSDTTCKCEDDRALLLNGNCECIGGFQRADQNSPCIMIQSSVQEEKPKETNKVGLNNSTNQNASIQNKSNSSKTVDNIAIVPSKQQDQNQSLPNQKPQTMIMTRPQVSKINVVEQEENKSVEIVQKNNESEKMQHNNMKYNNSQNKTIPTQNNDTKQTENMKNKQILQAQNQTQPSNISASNTSSQNQQPRTLDLVHPPIHQIRLDQPSTLTPQQIEPSQTVDSENSTKNSTTEALFQEQRLEDEADEVKTDNTDNVNANGLQNKSIEIKEIPEILEENNENEKMETKDTSQNQTVPAKSNIRKSTESMEDKQKILAQNQTQSSNTSVINMTEEKATATNKQNINNNSDKKDDNKDKGDDTKDDDQSIWKKAKQEPLHPALILLIIFLLAIVICIVVACCCKEKQSDHHSSAPTTQRNERQERQDSSLVDD